MSALLGVWVISTALGSAWLYDVGVRSEVRAATAAPGTEGFGGQQEIVPLAALLLRSDALSLSIAYDPRIYWLEPQASPAPNLLHRAQLLAEDKLSNEHKLFASEEASYGLNYFSPVAGSGGLQSPPGPTVQPQPLLPAVESAQYIYSVTAVGTDDALSRLWRLSSRVEYQLSGGADTTAQQVIPLQRGPRASVGLSYAASRLDTLTTTVDGLQARFSSGQTAGIAEAKEGWRTSWTRLVSTELLLGGAVVRTQPAGSDPQTTGLPIATLSLEAKSKAAQMPITFRLLTGVEPFLDVYAAAVYERAGLDASAGVVADRWELKARLQGTLLLNGDRQGQGLVVGELGCTRALWPKVKLEGGLRGYWERGLVGIPAGFQGALYLSLTADAPGVVGG